MDKIAATLLIILASVPVLSAQDKSDDALRAEMQQLHDRLHALKFRNTVGPCEWADAQIFVKAVRWALDFEPKLDAKNRDLMKKALGRARQRIDVLASGRQSFSPVRGKSVHGFISAIDDSVQPYGLVVPAGYDSSKPGRLDIVLHGSRRATGLGDLLFINDHDGGDDGKATGPNVNYIELHPMGRLGENAYRFEGETDIDEALEAVERHYRIDRKRIVLRGSSLGGVGTWQIGLKRPDRFVAIGPKAGPVDTIEFANSPWPHFVRLSPLTPWQKKTLPLVDSIDYTANARMVPVVAAMGRKDPYYSSHVLIQKAFEKEGIPFVGLVDPDAGHSVGAKVSQEQMRLLGEHAAKGLDTNPAHVRFVTWTLRYPRCHWVEILGLERHYERAEIDARRAADGSILVAEPKNITRFALHGAVKSLMVGETRIDVPKPKAGESIVVGRRDGAWTYQGTSSDIKLTGKRPGLQGPIDDAFARPFLCVRGTGKPWNAEVDAWADASLKRFAYEWRRHYRGDLRIKDDTAVTKYDLDRYNLVLFGDPGSNRWISDILPKLPVKWTRDTIQVGAKEYPAAGHGLQLIHPNPLSEGRYVVLNSGHTYHDAELRFSYMVFPRLGDWAVMRTGEPHAATSVPTVAETVLHSGFFDEAWMP